MNKKFVVVVLMLVGCLTSAGGRGTHSQDRAVGVGSEGPGLVDEGRGERVFAGRLPRFFASIVDDRQRMAIYEIQKAYYEQIAAVERQLVELKQHETGEIMGLLTEVQRQQLEAMRTEAANQFQMRVRGGQVSPSISEATLAQPPSPAGAPVQEIQNPVAAGTSTTVDSSTANP